MKRFIFSVIIVLNLAITSCSGSNMSKISGENNYLDNCYTYMRLAGDDGVGAVINRFNVRTGEVTCVCPDPLCDHLSCIFGVLTDLYYIYNNYIILPFHVRYDQDTGKQWTEAVKYDLMTGATDVFYDYGSTMGGTNAYADFSFIDGYMWGRYIIDNTGSDSRVLTGKNVIFRYDISLGVIEYMDGFEDIPTFYLNGRYYFTNELPAYSTDINGKNKITYDFRCEILTESGIIISEEDDVFIFEGYKRGGLYPKYYIVKVNASTGEFSTREMPNRRVSKLYNGYYYYVPYTEEDYLMGHDELQNKDVMNNTGGKLMRVPLDGGEPETVFDLGNEYYFDIVCILAADNKLVIDYGGFVEHSMYHVQTWNNTGGGKVVYDTATGEFKVYPRTWNIPNGLLSEQNIF